MWIDDFVALIESSTVANPQIESAIALKDKHLPKRIYKYRCDCDKSRANLADDTVWICSPQAYNDPFDCLFTVTESRVVTAAKRQLLDDFVRIYNLAGVVSEDAILHAKASDDPLQQIVKHISPGHTFPQGANPQQAADFIAMQLPKYIDDSLAFVRQIKEATKICSFSQKSDSIVMWGHYADRHKGFCVEYDLEPLPAQHALRRNLYPVIYSAELYDLTGWATKLVSSPRDQFNPSGVLLTILGKYCDWGYEEEWRFVMTEPRLTPNRPLSMPKPTRVFLGAKIENSPKQQLTELCRSRGIAVWRMEMAADGFKLKASEVE